MGRTQETNKRYFCITCLDAFALHWMRVMRAYVCVRGCARAAVYVCARLFVCACVPVCRSQPNLAQILCARIHMEMHTG